MSLMLPLNLVVLFHHGKHQLHPLKLHKIDPKLARPVSLWGRLQNHGGVSLTPSSQSNAEMQESPPPQALSQDNTRLCTHDKPPSTKRILNHASVLSFLEDISW